jgi:hypothetical protein
MPRMKQTAASPGTAVSEQEILELSSGEASFAILGTSPLFFNRMAAKAKRSLLLGSSRKNAAERAASIKHDPIAEFRDSIYRSSDKSAPTLLTFPASGLKGAMATAALDMPGSTKSATGRRIWVPGGEVSIWGIPELAMSVVRSADIGKTPDIRTRAILSSWCCQLTVRFVQPLVTPKQIFHLLSAGGIVCGIGDFRQEKGKGNSGQFRICDLDDPEFVHLQKHGGRAVQIQAMEDATPYDEDSQELLDFFHSEMRSRGRDAQGKIEGAIDPAVAAKAGRATNGAGRGRRASQADA